MLIFMISQRFFGKPGKLSEQALKLCAGIVLSLIGKLIKICSSEVLARLGKGLAHWSGSKPVVFERLETAGAVTA